ncbi:MAG: hypothetical protein DME38_13085 [Verrucomicrobia bacterium]|nr:MAG: hypothetical protein DME38_13085 [Verrucomicrobiota bacterium]
MVFISAAETGDRVETWLPARLVPFFFELSKNISLHEAKYLRRERWKTKGLEGPARSEGLGLGLAISKAIMELHGGKISAASKGKGTGATFRIEIKSVQD